MASVCANAGATLTLGVILVVALAIAVPVTIAQTVALNRARKAYRASLEKLKRDPHNPNLREQTLALGRRYVRASRSNAGGWRRSAFDEVELSKDFASASMSTPVPCYMCGAPAIASCKLCKRSVCGDHGARHVFALNWVYPDYLDRFTCDWCCPRIAGSKPTRAAMYAGLIMALLAAWICYLVATSK
jgi:hypothetical protein